MVRGDTDGDGLYDRGEVMESFVVTPCINFAQGFKVVTSDPLSRDADRDGVVDGDEESQGTDPRDPDTVEDGLVDNPTIDCQPTGCGTLVAVKFTSYFVGVDNCETGEKAEMRFNLKVEAPGNRAYTLNHSQDRVGTEVTIPFNDPGREFQLGDGETFTISGTVFEADSFLTGQDEIWTLGDSEYTLATLPLTGSVAIGSSSPGGGNAEACFDGHKLDVSITKRIGTAGCPSARKAP